LEEVSGHEKITLQEVVGFLLGSLYVLLRVSASTLLFNSLERRAGKEWKN